LKDELKAKGVPYADIVMDDDKSTTPPIHRILIKGVPREAKRFANAGEPAVFRLGCPPRSR
jgi:hypothetical protein